MSLPKRASIAVALAAIVVVAVVVVARLAAQPAGCGPDRFPLDVSADTAIAPALASAAQGWQRTETATVAGECIKVVVTAASPIDTANQLLTAAAAGVALPKGATPSAASDAPLPAVWIPDSSVWLDEVQSLVSDEFTGTAPSLAASPVLLGVRASQADALAVTAGTLSDDDLRRALAATRTAAGAQKAAPFELGLTDPRYDASGLAAATKLTAIEPADELGKYGAIVQDYRNAGLEAQRATDVSGLIGAYTKKNTLEAGAPPMTVGFLPEQAILAYDQDDPADPIQAVRLTGVAGLDYPMAQLSGLTSDQAQAAAAFIAGIRSSAYAGVFAAAGFREPDGGAAAGFPTVAGIPAGPVTITPLRLTGAADDPVGGSLGLWSAANSSANVAVLLDVNSSMNLVSSNGSQSRLQLMQQAAEAGVKLFTGDSDMALREFGYGIGQDNLVSLVARGQLLPAQQATLRDALAGIRARATGSRCGLYKALKATYEQMMASYQPGELNPIVVITDCAADEPGMSLDDLTGYLSGTVNPSKPIPVILISVAPSSAGISGNLAKIATAVGGDSLPLTHPADILTVFITAIETIDKHA